jgi:hypothetical protein
MRIDFDLLAATYLGRQEAGPALRSIAKIVAEYRRENPTPGRRRARKTDLAAAASNANRLRSTLARIDPRTRAAAIRAGIDRRDADTGNGRVHRAPPVTNATSHTMLKDWGAMCSLLGTLETIELGFAALSSEVEVPRQGGAPERHDALQLGLESLLCLWREHRPDPPTQSRKRRGFAALAIDMFANATVGFAEQTVMGAVVDMLPDGMAPATPNDG